MSQFPIRPPADGYGVYKTMRVVAPDGYEIVPEGARLPRVSLVLVVPMQGGTPQWCDWNTPPWPFRERAKRRLNHIVFARKVGS